jgi:hypothetical protein
MIMVPFCSIAKCLALFENVWALQAKPEEVGIITMGFSYSVPYYFLA